MTLYPIDWHGGCTHFRRDCRQAVRQGHYEGLSDAEIADVLRERARLLEALDGAWTATEPDRGRRGWRVRPPLDRAISRELNWYRQAREPAEYHPQVAPGVGSTLRLLADQLDPERSVLELHRRWYARTANHYRQRGDDDEADRYLGMMRRVAETHDDDGRER